MPGPWEEKKAHDDCDHAEPSNPSNLKGNNPSIIFWVVVIGTIFLLFVYVAK